MNRPFALVLVVLGGCPGSADPTASTAPQGTAHAHVTIEREGAPPVRFDADSCWSGELRSFLGVEFPNAQDFRRRIRLVDDAVAGLRVVLLGVGPGVERVVLDAKSCTTFEVSLEKTHPSENDIRVMKARFRVQCRQFMGQKFVICMSTRSG